MPTEQLEKAPIFARNRSSYPLRFASVIMLMGLQFVPTAHADSRSDYLNALKLAQAKVDRIKQSHAVAMSLSSSIVRSLFGRYFREGDSWDVAAWDFNNPMMRMTSDPELLKLKTGRGGIFHYEVTQVRTGDHPGVVIRVTQLNEFGMGPIDSKVQELTLTMSDQMIQSEKNYRIAGRAEPVKVSPNGIHSSLTALELYPLDAPDILTAVRTQAASLPELPEKVQALARQAGYAPSLPQSYWFEQDDLFGRPVQVLWQQGDPWPAYLKTSNGIAILIRKRTT